MHLLSSFSKCVLTANFHCKTFLSAIFSTHPEFCLPPCFHHPSCAAHNQDLKSMNHGHNLFPASAKAELPSCILLTQPLTLFIVVILQYRNLNSSFPQYDFIFYPPPPYNPTIRLLPFCPLKCSLSSRSLTPCHTPWNATSAPHTSSPQQTDSQGCYHVLPPKSLDTPVMPLPQQNIPVIHV